MCCASSSSLQLLHTDCMHSVPLCCLCGPARCTHTGLGQVHDMLVGEQGVDPTSQLYYTAIESHMAAAFPHKWAHWQQATSGGLAGERGRHWGCDGTLTACAAH